MPRARQYQTRSIEWARDRRVAIVAHPPGTGKSMIAIGAADPPALVVCPAVAKINWRREIDLWRPGESGEFEIASYADPDLFLVNARHYRTLIVDEVHYVKTRESLRSRLVCGLVRRISRRGRVLALSGTLVPNRPIELWPLLWSSRITDMSYGSYARRFCAAWENEYGVLDVRGASRLGELRRLLRPHCLRYEKKEVLPELPPKTYRVLALDLPSGKGEKRFSLEDLRRTPEPLAMEAMSTVLREQGERKVPLAIEHVRSCLESERKVLAFAWHRGVIEAVARGLRDYGAVTVAGGMTPTRRQRAVDLFQRRSSKCRVLVGQIRAAGICLNMTSASRVIAIEASWVPSDIEQAGDRAHRLGQTNPVQVDLLTIHRSIDEMMLRRCLEKIHVTNQIVPTSRTVEDVLE